MLRAGLPAGTRVTGGHLAFVVLIAGSTSTARAQEDLIAEIARTAVEDFAPPS